LENRIRGGFQHLEGQVDGKGIIVEIQFNLRPPFSFIDLYYLTPRLTGFFGDF
jgi:hypothetical protein